jgi:hypothetical protein
VLEITALPRIRCPKKNDQHMRKIAKEIKGRAGSFGQVSGRVLAVQQTFDSPPARRSPEAALT